MTDYTQTLTETVTLSEALSQTADIHVPTRWKNLVNGAWSTTTGGTKPTIDLITNIKRVDVANGDYVLIYPVSHTKKTLDVGYTAREARAKISVDVRTATSQARLQQLVREVDRIIMASRTNKSNTTFQVVEGGSRTEFSDKLRLLYRIVIDYAGVNYVERI